MSIRNRLLLNTVGIIALFALAVSLAVWLGWQRTIRTVAESLTGETLERTESDLTSFSSPIEKQLLEAASWGETGLLDPDDPEQVEDLLQSLIREYPWMSAASVVDVDGREFTLLHAGDVWKSARVHPGKWNDEVVWAEWADDVEKVTYREPVDEDPRQESWFLGAIALRNAAREADEEAGEENRIYWTEPHSLPGIDRPGMIGAVSFESEAGVDHVVAFEVLLLDVHRFTSSVGSDDNARAFIMTDDLLLMGLPLLPEARSDEAVEELLLREPSEVGVPLVADATNALISRVDAGNAFEFTSEGQSWWGEVEAFTLPGSEHRLLMVVMVAEHRLTGRLRHQLELTLLLTLVAAIVAIVWAVLTARSIGRPVELLAREGERLSRGDLDADPSVRSSLVEARRLSDALTQMRDSLNTLFQVERKLQATRDDAALELSRFPGYEVAGWGESADPADRSRRQHTVPHQVASVWDHFALENGHRMMLFVADATGEGLESVFLATQSRSLVRMAGRLNQDLGTVVSAINMQLHGDLPKGHFVSAWLGTLEANSSALTSVSAGIQTAFHYHADTAACETLTSEAMPLGVFEGAEGHDSVRITMAPGDVFASASDGVLTLGGPATDRRGPELIARVLAAEHRNSATGILEALRRAIDEATRRAPMSMDCSVIIVKRVGDVA